MHEGLKRIEATKGRGREWESTAEKQQVIVKERDKGGGKSHKMFDGRKLAQELQQLTEEMNRELTTKRRIKITRLPYNVEEKEVLQLLGSHRSVRCKVDPKACTAVVLLAPPSTADQVIQELRASFVSGQSVTVQDAPATSLLFVGNIPLHFTSEDLRSQFSPYGELGRVLVVYSPLTGWSKGYGLVELALQEQALKAKQTLAMRTVGGRTLRVDCVDSALETVEDLQSSTLFVDQLPKGFRSNERLRGLFTPHGTVTFCQIALSSNSGAPRGFAFVDMATWEEAERAHAACNGVELGGRNIRVSFGMPGRPGSVILQPKAPSVQPLIPLQVPVPMRPPIISAPLLAAQMQLPGLLSCYKSADTHPSVTHPSPFSSLSASLESLTSQPENRDSDWDSGRGYSIPSSLRSSTSSDGAAVDLPPPSPPITLHLPSPANSLNLPASVQTKEHTGSRAVDAVSPCVYRCKHCGRESRSRKRSFSDLYLNSSRNAENVYDKPFVHQHQQGIVYIHPAKRLKN